MEKITRRIRKEAEKISGEVVSLRRYFHQNPELGFEEYKTSEKISSFLRKNGIPCENKAKTGVVAHIGSSGGKTVGLRADMDALPVEEKTGLPFASVNRGIMHACGHDGHMAVVLGVAGVLKKFEKELKTNVKLIFQPSEERFPGGASRMIEEGVLDGVDYMLGFHFFPMLPLFHIWAGEGPVLANADFFSIRVRGKGGHGASPHLAKDPVACSAYLVTNLQTVISRHLDPLKPGVVSFCGISGGTAYNVIPEEVEIRGTVRSLEDSVKETIKELMKKKTGDICRSFGCRYIFKYSTFVPSCINDPFFSARVKEASLKILGPSHMTEYHPIMGGEDFALYSRKRPSCYLFAGIGDKFAPNHNNMFSIDERALPHMVSYLSCLLAALDVKAEKKSGN